MFKKTLAAVAVLGAFAGSAFAANVTMYGIIDTGLGYTSTDRAMAKTLISSTCAPARTPPAASA